MGQLGITRCSGPSIGAQMQDELCLRLTAPAAAVRGVQGIALNRTPMEI